MAFIQDSQKKYGGGGGWEYDIKKAATGCDRHIYKFSHFYNPLVSNSIDISSFSVKIKLSDRRR